MVSLRLLAAIVIFAAIAPGILMTAPAVAAQLASEWQLKPGQIGWLFSAELGAMSLATLPAWWWMSRLDWRRVALTAGVVFLAANLASAVVTQYETLLAARFGYAFVPAEIWQCVPALVPRRSRAARQPERTSRTVPGSR